MDWKSKAMMIGMTINNKPHNARLNWSRNAKDLRKYWRNKNQIPYDILDDRDRSVYLHFHWNQMHDAIDSDNMNEEKKKPTKTSHLSIKNQSRTIT